MKEEIINAIEIYLKEENIFEQTILATDILQKHGKVIVHLLKTGINVPNSTQEVTSIADELNDVCQQITLIKERLEG